MVSEKLLYRNTLKKTLSLMWLRSPHSKWKCYLIPLISKPQSHSVVLPSVEIILGGRTICKFSFLFCSSFCFCCCYFLFLFCLFCFFGVFSLHFCSLAVYFCFKTCTCKICRIALFSLKLRIKLIEISYMKIDASLSRRRSSDVLSLWSSRTCWTI